VSEEQLSVFPERVNNSAVGAPGKSSNKPKVVKKPKAPVPIAQHNPVAQVIIDSPLPHLDRIFDYAVPEKLTDLANPGVRVRVRFAGRLTDAWLINRTDSTDHDGELAPIINVISAERVLLPEILNLASEVADRQAGILSDVLRNAIPNRHAGAEETKFSPTIDYPKPVSTLWEKYPGGPALLSRSAAVTNSAVSKSAIEQPPRAIVTTGQDNPAQLIAEYLASVATAQSGVIAVVPDRAAIDRVVAKLIELGVTQSSIAILAADDGPATRYRNWLSVLRGANKIVVGTRSAVFAPVEKLAGIVLWDDWNNSHVNPQSPYWNSRDVAVLRSTEQKCALVLISSAMSVESFALQPWAIHISRSRDDIRNNSPRVRSSLDDTYVKQDPTGSRARIPALAMQVIKAALDSGPVLVLVARTGYSPRLSCDNCRELAVCSECGGGLSQNERTSAPTCFLCGHLETNWTCQRCNKTQLRAASIGSTRTAEEFGRAIPGVPVRNSSSDHILREVNSRPAIVVATPGAAPIAQGGYSALILLDAMAMLNRQDIDAVQDTYAKWAQCVSLVKPTGEVVVVAQSEHPAVQALIRHDPLGLAEREYKLRQEVSLPPAVRLAALTGTQADLDDYLAFCQLPAEVSRRGPVPTNEGQMRLLLSVPKKFGSQLSIALKQATAIRSARKKGASVNVRIDPDKL
jgi:primosomal protein N' (replication factor Y)